LHCFFLEPERGASHRVVAAADAGIARGQFTLRLEGDLLPETREMKHAEWAGRAGTDHWNVSVAHCDILSVWLSPRRTDHRSTRANNDQPTEPPCSDNKI